jgi:hypothetical protein
VKALPGSLVPDVVTSTQTWAVVDRHEMVLLLDRLLAATYLGVWPKYADRDDEWSGTGVYRLQVRLNRPEGRPLYSLKWEAPL